MLSDFVRRNFLYIAVFLLSAVLTANCVRESKYREKAEALEETVSGLNQEMKKERLVFRDSIAVCQAEIKTLAMTKDNIEARYSELLKASSLKPKDVNAVTEVVTVVHSVDTVYAEADSFGGVRAKLEDPFVSIGVEVFPSLETIIDYSVRDSLTVVSVQKKHSWLFGLIKWKEHKSVRVINHNPKADVTGLNMVEVIE